MIVAPVHGEVMTAVTVADGSYRIDVTRGAYLIAAIGAGRDRFMSQPYWVEIPARPSIRLNIAAPSMAI